MNVNHVAIVANSESVKLPCCRRCDSGEPVVARVTSEIIDLLVCARCAAQARQLEGLSPGALNVASLNAGWEEDVGGDESWEK